MIPRPSILGARAYWLLELDLGGSRTIGTPLGRVLRFADAPVAPVDAAGRAVKFQGGLVIGDVGRDASSLTVQISGLGAIDWAQLEARGISLDAATATLWRWYDSTAYERKALELFGYVTGVEYGRADEPASFAIAIPPEDDGTMVPDASMVVTAGVTWPARGSTYTVAPSAAGAAGPIIIGQPGKINIESTSYAVAFTSNYFPGSPAPMVEYGIGDVVSSRLLIAYHEIQAANVLVTDLSDDQSESLGVVKTVDARGRTVSVVDFGTTTYLRADPSHEYAVSFPAGGGLLSRDRSSPMRGLGEFLRYLLVDSLFAPTNRFRVPIDVGRLEAQRTFFDRFKLDGSITDQVSVWSLIQNYLVPLFPMVWTKGDGGWYFAAVRWDATAKDTNVHLSADRRQVARASNLVSNNPPGTNEFTLNYARNVASGNMAAMRVLTDQLVSGDTRYLPSKRCQISRAKLGKIATSMDAPLVCDDSTAELILRWLSYRDTLPRRRVQYTGGPELEALSMWDVVTITDADVYLSEVPALVADMQVGPTSTTVTLELLDDVTRRVRSTT